MSAGFFVLERKPRGVQELARTDVVPTKGATVGDAPRCSRCGGFVGMLKWLPPYRVEIDTWGDEMGDLAFGGSCEWILVSERFRTVYAASGMNGLSGFDPVEITRIRHHKKKRLRNSSDYYKADVIRSKTAVDHLASEFEWSDGTTICPVCLIPLNGVVKRWKRIAIKSQSWRGEDVFVPRGIGEIVTTRRFKELCEASGITNSVFIDAENYSHDYNPWEKNP